MLEQLPNLICRWSVFKQVNLIMTDIIRVYMIEVWLFVAVEQDAWLFLNHRSTQTRKQSFQLF